MAPTSTPVDVVGLTSSVTAISAGWDYTCAIISGGGAKCWGANDEWQLGNGTTTQHSTPMDVSGLNSGATAITAGHNHTCALVGSGRPKCWGLDSSGQLGVGTLVLGLTPVDVVEYTPPSLSVNYSNGQPGSFFTLTGWNFPPDTQATLSINGQVIITILAINPTGSFIVFLNTSGTEPGGYTVMVSVNPSATTGFLLADDVSLRLQEGGGQTFVVPAGIAFTFFLYLPLVGR
jgi:hypothetical protein